MANAQKNLTHDKARIAELEAMREKAMLLDCAMSSYGICEGFASRAYDESGLCAAREKLLAEARGDVANGGGCPCHGSMP